MLFALYHLPPADSSLYRLGSALLGYDVRAGERVSLTAELKETLGSLPEGYRTKAQPFGFHLTVVEALRGQTADLEAIEAEVETLLECFDPAAPFLLTRARLERWQNGQVWVWRYDASENLRMLQAVMMARLSPYAHGSMLLEDMAAYPEHYRHLQGFHHARLKPFLTPRGLDTWEPHYTLLNPYGGTAAEAARLEQTLLAQLPQKEVEVSSLCLMVKTGDAWRVAREFFRPSTP